MDYFSDIAKIVFFKIYLECPFSEYRDRNTPKKYVRGTGNKLRFEE